MVGKMNMWDLEMGWFSAEGGEQWSLHLWSFDVNVSWAHGLARRMETLYYKNAETVSLGSKLYCAVLCCSTYDVDVYLVSL